MNNIIKQRKIIFFLVSLMRSIAAKLGRINQRSSLVPWPPVIIILGYYWSHRIETSLIIPKRCISLRIASLAARHFFIIKKISTERPVQRPIKINAFRDPNYCQQTKKQAGLITLIVMAYEKVSVRVVEPD